MSVCTAADTERFNALSSVVVTAGGKIGDGQLELHPAGGHTLDGMAIWIPWARVLVAGDYLSTVEIPVLNNGDTVDAYLATLDR